MLYIILMQITKYYSPNFNEKPRSSKSITMIVIHYTGMQSELESIKRLTNPESKVSCHYLINKKGMIFSIVNELKIAWHAGKSKWKNYNNVNDRSIGIELVNKGHRYGYENFDTRQIRSLIYLCKKLKTKYKIKNSHIIGHSDIAPLRKIDPGEKFPWNFLNSKHLGIYSNKSYIALRNKKNKINKKRFFSNLNKIGYRYLNTKYKKKIICNFQRHFRQANISGILDEETLKISDYIAKNPNKT